MMEKKNFFFLFWIFWKFGEFGIPNFLYVGWMGGISYGSSEQVAVRIVSCPEPMKMAPTCCCAVGNDNRNAPSTGLC